MKECHPDEHWWVQDGPWTASCEMCGADAFIVLRGGAPDEFRPGILLEER